MQSNPLVDLIERAILLSVAEYGVDLVKEALGATMATEHLCRLEIYDGTINGLTPLIALRFTDSIESFKGYFIAKAKQIEVNRQRETQAILKAQQFIAYMHTLGAVRVHVALNEAIKEL